MDGRFLRILPLIFLLLLTACGRDNKENGPTRWQNFPVAIYADSSAVSSSADEADLRDAMNFWEQKVGKQLFDYRGAWDGSTPFSGDSTKPSAIHANVIFSLNPWSYSSNIAAQTIVMSTNSKIEGSLILVNPGIPFCTGDCKNDWRASQRRMLTHELGHFLGLGHVQDSNNIMYPDLLPGGTLAGMQVDISDLQLRTK